MSIIDDVKSVAQLIQQIDNVELYRKILDLQGEVMGLVQENSELRKEISSLKESLRVTESLKFERNVYWNEKTDGTKEGPFCSKCWDKEKLLVRMTTMGSPQYHRCPACNVPIKTSGRPDEVADIAVVPRGRDRGY